MSLADVFAQVRAENRAAFIAYYPAGYPTVDGSVDAIKAIVDAGADIVEVGLPYSDPMMDGPTIQEAANIALAEGFRIRDLFRVVREVTDAGGNCVTMTYWNPILQYGPEKFAEDFAAAGGLGAIIPDLLPEEVFFNKKIEPVDVMALGDDPASSLELFARMQAYERKFPGLDCGSCGSPTCHALAEDIVRGYCTQMDCIHILKDQLKIMAQKMVELAKTTRE